MEAGGNISRVAYLCELIDTTNCNGELLLFIVDPKQGAKVRHAEKIGITMEHPIRDCVLLIHPPFLYSFRSNLQPYDLPDGATTWRCAACHTFNSTSPG